MSSTIIVAIPVKDEVERIEGCLSALARQRWLGAPIAFEVLLFVNNSTDGTAALAEALGPDLPFPLTVISATLSARDAHAGGARRRAMEAAAQRLEQAGTTGILMTTDADSRVAPDWMMRTLAAIDAGVDAVAGTISLDPDDERAFPMALKARGSLEAQYEALVCELETTLNPEPHDPWPRHSTESGASLALTLTSYRAVGGVPDQALGEDRALVSVLRTAGFRIRHAPDVTVVTSGRLFGRAAGGCADTMRLRIEQPDARCDAYLRPAFDIVRRRTGRDSRSLAPRELPTQIRLARLLLDAIKIRADLENTTGLIFQRLKALRKVTNGDTGLVNTDQDGIASLCDRSQGDACPAPVGTI